MSEDSEIKKAKLELEINIFNEIDGMIFYPEQIADIILNKETPELKRFYYCMYLEKRATPLLKERVQKILDDNYPVF